MGCSGSSSGRRARSIAALFVAASALVAATAVTASAHSTDPAIRTVLDTVEPAVPGVTIQVAASVSAEVIAENTTTTELAVLAETGEPFLRIGPEGVFANVASPSWYLSNSPFGDAPIPPDVTADAAPRWTQVATEPSWGWFDHRLHPAPRGAPKTATGHDTVRLARWSIPFDYGERRIVARGRIVYAPASGAVTARLRSSDRPFADVGVQLAPGRVPGLFVSNRGPTQIVVVGAGGEPFLRIGPTGTEVNRHSPTWIENARVRGLDVAQLVADPDAAPDWELLSSAPRASWLEFRGNYERGEPPRSVIDGGNTKVLRRWSVPIERGGRTVNVRGETIWSPVNE